VALVSGVQPASKLRPGENVPKEELSQRDLSTIDDADLSPQERRELHRRFDDFVKRLRVRAGLTSADTVKPKRITRWDPAAISRRH
jgi:hypothetical protein